MFFITSPFMCKSLQIFEWNHVVKRVFGGFKPVCRPPANKSLTFKTEMCFIAKTKPQYQSDKTRKKERDATGVLL